ncbi:hypothetical protein DRO59_03295 [Candidatus Bathyarchaeota archaeon]|nr:MAG: hypothetical protein DRO59_03295 [Candidatus Bathyarchaeota archaeon]
MERVVNVVREVAYAIVGPNKVKVEHSEGNQTLLITLRAVDRKSAGLLIGKNGRIISAIRVIAQVVGQSVNRTMKVVVEVFTEGNRA